VCAPGIGVLAGRSVLGNSLVYNGLRVPRPERKLIERIRSLAAQGKLRPGAVVTGIGDDCAVLRPVGNRDILVTTDFSLEGVHFRREWHPAESVGHRCLTRGLSDIAAMGGDPFAVFLSLALPVGLPQRWVDGFYKGLLRLAERHGATLAGGDTAQSPGGVLADIMVVGSVPRGKALLRSGAKPGDKVYVTGKLGLGGATVRRLYAGERVRPVGAYFYPEPRVKVGRSLRRSASAAIDISDGLSTDLSHICEEGGVGAVIYSGSVPIAAGATLEDALRGGDDYELLFTSSTRVPSESAGVAVSEIGEIVNRRGMWIQDEQGRSKGLKAQGWEHFRESTNE
jgi:thiamine-monophosphate kinase